MRQSLVTSQFCEPIGKRVANKLRNSLGLGWVIAKIKGLKGEVAISNPELRLVSKALGSVWGLIGCVSHGSIVSHEMARGALALFGMRPTFIRRGFDRLGRDFQ